MSAPWSPRPSSHAKLRLVQRGGVEVGSLLEVWREARPVTPENRDFHHAKYHEEHDVILLERGGVITTVLRADFEIFSEAAR